MVNLPLSMLHPPLEFGLYIETKKIYNPNNPWALHDWGRTRHLLRGPDAKEAKQNLKKRTSLSLVVPGLVRLA